MITPEKKRLFPQFLLSDQTGNAMAAAITKGMEIFCRTIDDGIGQLTDPDRMTEKRLDEMALEYGIYYDYSAGLEEKREIIRNAYKYYAAYGTPWAVQKFGLSMLQDAEIVEDGSYSHQFWALTARMPDEETAKKVVAAIEATKNVRSRFAGIVRKYIAGITVDVSSTYH